MKIDQNKDFETQFKAESWKGFTLPELLCGGTALGLAGIAVFLVWHFTGLPINVSVYFGIPVMAPVIAIGMMKYQGHSLYATGKEVLYFLKTRNLCTQMEERKGGGRIFTMASPPPEGKQGKRPPKERRR